MCEFSSHVQRLTCPGIGGGELDSVKACVLSEEYIEVREGKGNEGYIQKSD